MKARAARRAGIDCGWAQNQAEVSCVRVPPAASPRRRAPPAASSNSKVLLTSTSNARHAAHSDGARQAAAGMRPRWERGGRASTEQHLARKQRKHLRLMMCLDAHQDVKDGTAYIGQPLRESTGAYQLGKLRTRPMGAAGAGASRSIV